jgi:hypothetical protein
MLYVAQYTVMIKFDKLLAIHKVLILYIPYGSLLLHCNSIRFDLKVIPLGLFIYLFIYLFITYLCLIL